MHKTVFIIIIFCLFLFSCYNRQLITEKIPVDSTAIELFSEKVITRFTDYAETSRNYAFPPGTIRIGPCGIFTGLIFINKNIEKHDIILYTFDGRDSCILYSDTLRDNIYELSISSISVPDGYYFIKDSKDSTRYSRPPDQALKLTRRAHSK